MSGSQTPIITFRAGICDVDTSVTPHRITPKPDPGYIYLYNGDEELIHFCWRKRTTSPSEPELDLVMIPTDGDFINYDPTQESGKTNGRIFFIKFASSSQRHFFWLQSAPANPAQPHVRSARDNKIAEIVYTLLQGDEVDVREELAELDDENDDEEDYDDEDDAMDDAMDDAAPTGGAGADATGGDVREEGEESREGGADGARASGGNTDTQETIRNLLSALEGSLQAGGQNTQGGDLSYPSLNNLLTSSTTIPLAQSTATEEELDRLLDLLPPVLVMTTAPISESLPSNPSKESMAAVSASLSIHDKRELITRVLRSPQFSQSLGSLTMAIRDGGLPTITEALQVEVENGGYMRGGGMPEGGNRAVRAFVEGVRKTAKKEQNK